MMFRWIAPFLACALALSAHAAPTSSPEGDPAEEAKPTIDQANTEWEGCIKTLDTACIVKPYADDALFILPDGKVVAGKAAIADLYAARSKSGSTIVSAKIDSEQIVAASKDLVFERGTGTMQAKGADGTETTRGGPYLTVWRRDADGKWQIIRNLVF